jgi:hypothetical protein
VPAHHSLKVPSARSSKLPAPSPPSGTALRIPLGGGSLPLPCDRYGRTLTCGVLVRVAICERQQEGGTEPQWWWQWCQQCHWSTCTMSMHMHQCSAVQCALRSMYGARARDLRWSLEVQRGDKANLWDSTRKRPRLSHGRYVVGLRVQRALLSMPHHATGLRRWRRPVLSVQHSVAHC